MSGSAASGESLENPESLLARLKLGREEYCQRLLTSLIVGGPYPKWNSRSRPSAAGRAFLANLYRLSFGQDPAEDIEIFVDEFDLPQRSDDEPGCAPDWTVLW